MRTYTAKEAKNRLGEVLRVAESEVVEITNHGKPIVRVLSIKKAANVQFSQGRHADLDVMKHRISCEVLSRFSVATIRQRSKANLQRWKAQGTWSQAYEDWAAILETADDQGLIASMVGSDQRSNQLRQSMPYVGILDQSIVRKIHEEIAS